MKYLRILSFLFLAVGLQAGYTRKLEESPARIQNYMLLNAQVYNDGYLCRNAAANVAVLATEYGDQVTIPRYWTKEDKTEGHAFALVLFHGDWWAVDSVYHEGYGKYVPRSMRLSYYDPDISREELSEFSLRPLLEYYGDATTEKVEFWFREPEILEDMESQISDLRRKVGVGERVLKLLNKHFPNIWEVYEKAVEKYQNAGAE